MNARIDVRVEKIGLTASTSVARAPIVVVDMPVANGGTDEMKTAAARWTGERIDSLLPVVHRLLSGPAVGFDAKLRSNLPSGAGIYAISRKGAKPGDYLRAGKTERSLRQRIYQNHLMGDQKGSLRWQLVKDGVCESIDQTKVWICDNCEVRFLAIPDGRERSLAEHFMLSVLQPKYIDQGTRGIAEESSEDRL